MKEHPQIILNAIYLEQDKRTRFYIASDDDDDCKVEIINRYGSSHIITNHHKADRSTPQV